MSNTFKLRINTPAGIFFEDEVLQVEIKTPNGIVGLLANHQPIIGSIVPSVCFVRDEKGDRLSILVNTGIFKMDGKLLNIISDFVDFTDKLDQSVLEDRQKQIEQALQKNNDSANKDLDLIKQKLEEEIKTLLKLSEK